MELKKAARELGVSESSSRSEARSAYLVLMSDAAEELRGEPEKLEERRRILEAAYEEFGRTNEPDYRKPSNSNAQPKRHRSKANLAILFGSAAAVVVSMILASVFSDSDSSPTPKTEPSSDSSPTPKAELPDADIGNRGESSYLNTCWRESSGQQLQRVACGRSHDWVVSNEVRSELDCPASYLEADSWFLCLRESR